MRYFRNAVELDYICLEFYFVQNVINKFVLTSKTPDKRKNILYHVQSIINYLLCSQII